VAAVAAVDSERRRRRRRRNQFPRLPTSRALFSLAFPIAQSLGWWFLQVVVHTIQG